MFSPLVLILLALAGIVAVFLVVAAMQPAEFRVVRSATISAPPETVFAQVNDFHKWDGWSPWAKLDPAVVNTYEGPPAGAGAGFHWRGNKQVGEGHMTITESHPSDLIKIRLEFIRPFAATNSVEYTFKPEGSRTIVTWSMLGQRNFVLKAFGLFMNMDKMLGGEFEKGLANLKAQAEAAVAA
jgi:uncharacterized protein YndB with AHSA1/START domain